MQIGRPIRAYVIEPVKDPVPRPETLPEKKSDEPRAERPPSNSA